MEDRSNSETLLKLLESVVSDVPKKSPEKSKRKISFESDTTEVEIKKQATLTKNAIELDLSKSSKQTRECNCSEDPNSPRKSFASSAKKVMSNIWSSLTMSP